MEFALFQWIGGSVDAMLNTLVSQTASNAILGFQLIVLTGVTLYITLAGYATISGAIEQPFKTLGKQCLKIIIIASFCMSADSYNTTVVSAIHGLESGIADILSSPDAKSDNIYQVLDKSVDSGLNVAYDMLGKASKREFFEIGQMFWDLLNALMMAVAVFLIHVPAAATIIMVKLGLSVLLGIGPIFVAALLFPITAPWFDQWFKQAMAFILEIAITMVVVSVGVALYKALFDKVIVTGADNPISSFVQIIIVAAIVFYALKKTSGLGSQLAGGISFGVVTFRSMGETLNPKTTRRDMQSGQMVTAGRTNHLIAGNTAWNPAYRQHVIQNMGKNWGNAKGGKIDGR